MGQRKKSESLTGIKPMTLAGVWKVMGLIAVGDSEFCFVPRLRHVDQFRLLQSRASLAEPWLVLSKMRSTQNTHV